MDENGNQNHPGEPSPVLVTMAPWPQSHAGGPLSPVGKRQSKGNQSSQ